MRAVLHAPAPTSVPAPRLAAPQRAILRKAVLGPVDDPLEREADQVADAVVGDHAVGGFGQAPAGSAQRKCAECEEEEGIQRKCAACEAEEKIERKPTEAAARAVSQGGEPLSPEARAYFEPRFGRDFSGVRIHTGGRAAAAAGAIDARAYTLGSDIAFASGEFDPQRDAGRRLLAHELTHVVQQQRGAAPALRRTVTATSRCPPNVHGAPADPIAELTADDERAQLMALGTSNVLALEALTFADPTFGRSYVSDAYERRFGLPPAAARGRFRNRFTGRTHATQNEAMREEMLSLSDRFRQLHDFLSGPIRYRCPGTSAFTLPGCASARCGGSIALSCPGGRQIAICPTFWTFPLMQTVDQRGGNMIHESVHMRLGFRGHGLANANQRGRNPECHAAIVADVYGFQSDDTTDCTPLIP
ncbi:eCIS core domain-containing protein [Mesorhizobium sp. L-8-3]|uniref:eCIS core domain-containing protein n=1 Tax=Mesorhizobium sp. L-8-3 TaxID=2744522 RepID=UPI0019254ADA|nr:DUF4157 domain-containing protein [Mesorhizobium sp. L-8-3]BCH26324.1 hypothetical protein MesoLjLb_61090 [Mesorhizobium sp. L-8-3]